MLRRIPLGPYAASTTTVKFVQQQQHQYHSRFLSSSLVVMSRFAATTTKSSSSSTTSSSSSSSSSTKPKVDPKVLPPPTMMDKIKKELWFVLKLNLILVPILIAGSLYFYPPQNPKKEKEMMDLYKQSAGWKT